MSYRIFFKDIQKTIEVPEGMTILEAAEEAEIEIPFGCRKGDCGTCKIKKVLGEVQVAKGAATPKEYVKKGLVLTCVSAPKTDLVCETTFDFDETEARVVEVIKQTCDTKSFRLALSNKDFYRFNPGQFLTVAPTINNKKLHRCYTISSSCSMKDYLEITVKKQKEGLVSNHFNDNVKVGDIISVNKPRGRFKLNLKDGDGGLVLVGSGSGITPLISMIRSLTDKKSSRKITLLYGVRTDGDIIFHYDLIDLQQKNPNFSMRIFLSRPDSDWGGATGRITGQAIIKAIQTHTSKLSLYTCGPGPLMDMAVACGKESGLPSSRCHKEVFAPPKSVLPLNCLTLDQMRNIKILETLSTTALESLQKHVMLRKFMPGEVIVREGEYGSSAFYVLEGKARVYLAPLDLSVLGRKPQRKRSVWERLVRWIKKNRRGFEFVFAKDVEVSQPHLNTEGVLYDKEGKTSDPHYLPRKVMDANGNLVEKDRFVNLGQGEIFGELAALFRSHRTATVTADPDSDKPSAMLEITVQALRLLSKYNKTFESFIDKRFRDRSLMQFLKDAELFAECDNRLLEEISRSAKFYHYKPHEVIARQGDQVERFFVIISGFVRVSKRLEGKELNFHYFKKGDHFGEHTLLYQKPRGSSITAINNIQVIGLNRSIFQKLVEIDSIREKLVKSANFLEEALSKVQTQVARLSLLSIGIENGLINGQNIMVINLDQCTRCDDCVRACADSHDGYPRFAREGMKFDNMLLPHSCMHCIDPLCMDGCPSGALHRSAEKGEVLINLDTCVGCSLCVENCVYGNIVPLPVAENVLPNSEVKYKRNPANSKPVLKSMKCDLCLETGDPACVRACPHDALHRLTFDEIFKSRL